MFRFFKMLFVGPETANEGNVKNAYKQQINSLNQIWNDHTYGVERLFRLFLCLGQFIYPTLLIRSVFCRSGTVFRKLAVESYIIIKLFFPMFVLLTGLYRYNFIICIMVYLLTETIFHILNLIFLSDIYSVRVAYRHSILFLFLHYIEVIFDFSCIYLAFDLLNKTLTPVSAIYFSFVTNTTLGFGEYHPKGGAGQVVVIFQLMIFLMFIFLFINHFSSRADNKD